MESAGLSRAAVKAFERAYGLLVSGESAVIPEASLSPVGDLTMCGSLGDADAVALRELIARTVVLKLNGGLGTGMGLDRAKSLLPVRGGDTFLDLIVRQILGFRGATGSAIRVLFLNSFSTSADTLAHLSRYPELGDPRDLELLQNKVPKVNAADLTAIAWPADPDLEWCPPGHGDIYSVLLGSGLLGRLLDEGFLHVFVSNSDNLGATLDPRLLAWFAASGKPFVMEVTARTAADRKGGHLGRRASDGRLVLRESSQCAAEDSDSFQDIAKHRYFNTNNLWLRLDRLAAELTAADGLLPLPVIRNKKTVDPRDKKSPEVWQLETAMGAAIECFDGADAIAVPRSRFAPVKTTSDLLALRSDAYVITPSGSVELARERNGVPPEIVLDPDHFKLVDQLDAALAGGVPSLIACERLEVRGPATFDSSMRFAGKTVIVDGRMEGQPGA